MPSAGSVSFTLAVKAGSIYDPPRLSGLAHFLEHLVFKATDDYTRHELAATMQRCGNRFDPATSKEAIAISGSVPSSKVDEALALIASVAQRPRFASDDIETERLVVLEELRDWEDAPSKRIEVLADAALWGAHPMGRDIGGKRSTVREITRDQVRRFHRRYFHPRNAVLSIAGAMSEREMLSLARRHFGGWKSSAIAATPRRHAAAPLAPAGLQRRRSKVLRRSGTSQVWFSASTTTPSYPDGYDAVLQAQLAQVLIGDGDGSRLWDGMRERMGLAYEVYATLDFYSDVGVMSAMAAVGRNRAGVAVREMKRLLEDTSRGFSVEEFARGKEALAAQIDLGAQWPFANAARYAELALIDQPLVTAPEERAMLDNVGIAQFNEFVRERIRWDAAAVCAIGEGPALDEVRA
ncbi:MAG TPA: pitrilysin family protein [Candidatus Eremiobacteraceae bacterium]|nr:pitrilysin family protein [Candidatus Eremiobacteraceae bacterium]